MWLPTPLYERAPQFWLLLGLLFMSAGTYVGFEHTLAFVHFGVGFFSVAWSFGIWVMRSKHRRGPYPVRGLHMTQAIDLERTQPIDVTVTEVFRKEAAMNAGTSARRSDSAR